MIRRVTARWQHVIGAMPICIAGVIFGPAAQASGPGIANKLERAGVIDNYFPEVVLEVAGPLVQAAPGRWRGVQVNQPYRTGWLNIYLIDARRLPQRGLLDDEGVPDFTADNLRGGARADEATDTIFLNTAAGKRLTAATVMKQSKLEPDLTAALARVDAIGLEAARRFWDPAGLSVNTPTNQRVGWLTKGALAFVLAHEMGHLQIGRVQSDEADMLRLKHLTPRQQDERRACPELVDKGSRQSQQREKDADMAAVALLGQQCRIGTDGQLRHAINMLGTTWYLLASMSDKLLEMGRNTDSPVIAQALQAKIGPELYQQVVAAQAAERRSGAVGSAFPLTHPPDTERMQAIEVALRASRCGSGGLDIRLAQMLETYRVQMCRRLIAQE